MLCHRTRRGNQAGIRAGVWSCRDCRWPGTGHQRHSSAVARTFCLARSWEGLAYSGQDRFGGIPALPNVQLRVLTVGSSASAVLNNCKDRSTDDETTEYGNDNHGFDSSLRKVSSTKHRHPGEEKSSNISVAVKCGKTKAGDQTMRPPSCPLRTIVRPHLRG